MALKRAWLIAIVCLLCGLAAPKAFAQSDTAASDLSFFLGDMLPYQIQGVSDILPLFGGRYSLDYNWGAIEFEGENAHAQGVDWTQIAISYRADIPVSSGIDASVYIGPDLLWYIPINDTVRHTDYGIHGGLAALLQVKDSLWLRADLKLMLNTGSALYILGGIMFRPGGSSSP